MGFLDNLFPNKKEKVPKSDRNRRPQSQVTRPPPRPAPQPPDSTVHQHQAPSTTASIFGSLRRLKGGGVATSTPKKTDKDESKSRSRSARKSGAVSAVTPTVDRNANVEGFSSVSATDGKTVNEQVSISRRGKENVEEHRGRSNRNGRPESRVVTAFDREHERLKKERVKSSTASLNNLLRVQPKSIQSQQPKPKRPATIAVPSNVSVRRGHKEGHPDNISRTSSVTNLDSLEANLQGQQGKGTKPRKVASKERIDKQTQDGKKITKNNNKLEPPPAQPLSYSSESLHEAEIQQLRKQLRDMSDEKSSLALQLGEQRGQLNVLQKEIQKLKSFQEENNLEIDKLTEENTTLRNRLRDVAHSPLSDNEKQQLLFESRHSSAPASIATNVIDDNGGDATACTTPDWDRHSNSTVSVVSVAGLQDKISQMEETHYSTNEELQATLQELTDLQRQLTELQQENERLNEEKTLMFDSLCRQTERLNDSRQEVENLKQFLYRDRSDETGINQLESVVEREQKLVELLRSAQEEREQLLLKLEQLQAELQDSRAENIDKGDVLTHQIERVKTLECTLDAKHAEHKQLDQELAQAKDHCSGKQIEINRLTDLLENARTKILELEQDRTLSDKSELDELLDNARKEKDQLESEVAYLKEQLARSKNEIEKLKEQVFVLQEECKVTRNNAKTTQSDLEYKCEKLVTEKNSLGEQLQQFQEGVNELQVQAQCHLEDKRQLSAVLSETQRNLSEAERRNLNLETEIQELKKLSAEENDEWEKFQNDLLTSVRVANDFKTEAQQELQKIILENKTYREKLRLLEGQVEKLKGEKPSTSTQTDIILTPQLISLAKNLDQSIPNRISLFEHPISHASSPTSPTSSMDKLFPILSKQRRNRSRENLSEDESKNSETSIRSKENLSSFDGSKKSSMKVKKGDKGKEKPADEPKKENRSFFKRNKSKDNLEEPSQSLEGSSKESKGFLKKNRSKDDLKNFGEVGTDTSKSEEPSKGFRNFLRRNKSKDNLEQYTEVDNSSSKKDDPLKREAVDKPRKSTDSSSSSAKSDLAKPEFFSKFIKKRDKKFLSHRKTMSVEESILLKSLDNWYGNIDQNVPDEFLSKEDQAVKKLKILFEDDQLKEKPVAHKPKEQLAISKPLLNSVVLNPKLEEIVRNPRFPTVEMQVRESALEDTFTLVNEEPGEHYTTTDGPRLRIRSEEVYTNIGPKSLGIHKCHSLDDLNVFEEYRTDSELAPALYRATETDNLAKEGRIEIKTVPSYHRVPSEIYPNDSVSNPRYSTRYQDVHMKEYVPNDLPKPSFYINSELAPPLHRAVETDNFTKEEHVELKTVPRYDASVSSEIYPNDSLSNPNATKYQDMHMEEYVPNDLPKPNVYINYENLDEIINELPKDVPESKLTEEQRFALKLKLALDDAEKNNIFKKNKKSKKSIKGLEISGPTPESVQKNWKLKEIMLNPGIKKAEEVKTDKFFLDLFDEVDVKRHSTDISSAIDGLDEMETRPATTSKSYEDISFSFVPENTLMHMYYGKKDRQDRRPKVTTDSSSSSHSFTSAEFNLDTGKITQKWDIPPEAIVKQPKVQSQEDLLYNETINKEKNKKRNKGNHISDVAEYKESLNQLKRDLSPTKANTSKLEIEDPTEKGQDLWLKGSLDRYKKDLNQMVKRIDSDQLRESLRRRAVKSSSYETQYQVAQSETVFDEYKVSHISPLEIHNERQHEIKNTEEPVKEENINTFVQDSNIAAVDENIIGNETSDSISYETITEFILNERQFSSDYRAYDQRERNIQEKDMAMDKGESMERDIQISLTGTAVTENQSENSIINYEEIDFAVTMPSEKSTSENKYKREQSSVTDMMIDENEIHSKIHPVSKPSPKRRNKVTLSFYDIRFQTPVEVNTQVETSKTKVLNKPTPTTKIEKSHTTEKTDVNMGQELVVGSYNESADTAVDDSILYDIINEFIFNERMNSEGYINQDKRETNIPTHNVNLDSIENNSERNLTGPDDPNKYTLNVAENEHINNTTGNIKDPFGVIEQSDDEKHANKIESSFVDLVTKKPSYEVSHGLDNRKSVTSEEKGNSKSIPVFKSSPLDRTEVTSSFYDIRFQYPVEINTHVEAPPKIEAYTADKSNMHCLEEGESHGTWDEAVNLSLLYNTITDFISNERIFTEGYSNQELRGVDAKNGYPLNKTWAEPKEPIILQCPTGLITDEALIPEQNSNDDSPFGVEAINSIQQEMFKNQHFTTDDNNEPVKVSQVVIEDVTYQLPSTSAEVPEYKYSASINEILDENVPETIPDAPFIDPTFSHSGTPETTADQRDPGTIYSSHLVDMVTPQTAEVIDEYSSKDILRENQYGVVSPLDLRYTYRGVVKEYKRKYRPEPTEEMNETNPEGSDQSDIEYEEDFIDQFFKPPNGLDHGVSPKNENVNYIASKMEEVDKPLEVEDNMAVFIDQGVDLRREEAVSQIDQEMQAIMEKYLHTRTSLIVKESGVDIKHEENHLELKTNLKKYDNFENLNDIDTSDSKGNTEEAIVLEPVVIFENEDVKCVELGYLESTGDDEPLSLEDLKFIEEMKARYTTTDTVSTISDRDTELLGITEEEIEHKYQNLTDEELNLIRATKSDRFSRPLSDINERDLLLIDEISRKYFHGGSFPPSVRNSLQETTEFSKVVKEENEEIEENIAVISEDRVDPRKDVIPPLPSSLPPKPSSDYQHEAKETLRDEVAHEMSDDPILSHIHREFIFNERLFSDSCNFHDQSKNKQSIDQEFQITFTGPVITENQFIASEFKESQRDSATEQKGIPDKKVSLITEHFGLATSPNNIIVTAHDAVRPEKAIVSGDIKQSKNPEVIREGEEYSYLPPSLRPRKPTAQRPVSLQPHGDVIFRDKSKLSSSQRLASRPNSNADRSSGSRLSDLMFKETIFVPVSKEDRLSSNPNSPLSPSFKHIEMGGTWRNHEKPDYKQIIVVPTPQKLGFPSASTKEVKSPTLKSPAFNETLFIPSTVKPTKAIESPTSTLSLQKTNKPDDLSFKETIIIPSQQKSISYPLGKHNFSKDPPKSPQSHTNVTIINRPGYHSYKETSIAPKPQESPEPKDQTQSKPSSKSEVKVNFNRYSAIPKPIGSSTTIRTTERRPLSEPFKLKSLDNPTTTYEPVYSNVNYGSGNYKAAITASFKKKPLPVPRGTEATPSDNEYHAGTSFKHGHVKSKNDNFVNMTDSNENFSERLANTETPNTTNFAQLQAKFSEGETLKEEKAKIPIAPERIVEEVVVQRENVPSDRVILVESKAETDILRNKNKLEPKESAGSSMNSDNLYFQNAPTESLNTEGMSQFVANDEESVASGSSSTVKSAASFGVTTKGENPDITKMKAAADYVLDDEVEDVDRKPSGTEVSNVNLFTMDSHSSYDSYLEIFKSKESKDFDDLRGKKSPHKNYLAMSGFAYVEELDSEDQKSDDIQDETKPKIVDFVPLDEDTTPFFTKEDIKESYDTLEREKTFHILGQASKISDKLSSESSTTDGLNKENIDFEKEIKKHGDEDKDNLETSLEILSKKSSSFSKASSKSHTDTSGTSFTQAKKIFEALVEANNDERPKTAVPSKSPHRYNNVRDSRSMDQMRMRDSKEGEVRQLGETGLFIKDGAQAPLDGGAQSK